MGWGSATSLFDGAVDVALLFAPKTDGKVSAPVTQAVVEAMYTRVDWEDWDTQSESDYYPYLIEVMHHKGHISEAEYAYHHSDDPDNFDWSYYRGY